MKLYKSKVVFDARNHTYTLDGHPLSGITGMIERQLFPDKYTGVPENILRKAAERGSLIHSLCQTVDEMGVDMDSEEARGYMELKGRYGLQYEASEYLVSDEVYFASCIDKVYRDGEDTYALGDIKTTYRLDKDYLRWQLSIYASLFEMQNPGAKVSKLFGIWLRGDIHELVEIERIPDDVVCGLLNCEVEGRQFVNPYASEMTATLPEKYLSMEDSIAEIYEQARYWAERKKELTDGVMKEMVKAGAYNWKGGSVSFIRKKDTVRRTFDTKAFERDHPELYQEYMKETPVFGSVTLKVS